MSNQVKQLTLSAFFLALGSVLPLLFHSFGPRQAQFSADAYTGIAVRICMQYPPMAPGWHADTAAVECINRHAAAAHADRNCHVFGAVDVWLF